MSSPRVTVIIATFDYGRHLRTALASVQAQTLCEWECIVVDDASTDDTPAILAEASRADPRIRSIRSARNIGVSAARNLALEQARGAFIQFLDADDAIAPAKLERQAAYLEAHPDVAMVCSDMAHFTDSPDLGAPGELRTDERIDGPGAPVLKRLLRGNVIRINTALARTDALRAVGGFRTEFRTVEDWHLWMSLAAAGNRFAYLDDAACLAAVRVNPQGLSKDAAGMRRYRLPALQDIWVRRRLGPVLGLHVLLRYADLWLEMRLSRREPVIRLPEGRALFLLCALPITLASLPIWILSRPFRGR